MATDPICGMTVDPKSAAGKNEYSAETYYVVASTAQANLKKVRQSTPN